jgi:cobalt/nickel transport system permease protein
MHHAHIDRLSCQDSPIHRLDGRSKIIATLAYTACIVSLPANSVSILAPCLIGPFAILIIASIPLKFVIKQILIASPFIAVVAAASLFYRTEAVDIKFGTFSFQTTEGIVRCFSILGKFVVTVTTLIALVATTRFDQLLTSMARLGMPKILVMQIGFLYRYIFLLIDKGHHVIMARSMRTLRRLPFKTELKVASAMISNLFISSVDSAVQITMAMQSRGFDGRLPGPAATPMKGADYLFIIATLACAAIIRMIVGSF